MASGSTLSYIDMVSGGFGAAFFLFLMFVTLPFEVASIPSSGSRFLDVWLEWDDPEMAAYMVVRYTPEGREVAAAPRTYVYSMKGRGFSRDSATNALTYSGSDPAFWTAVAEAGYRIFSEGGLMFTDGTGQPWSAQWMRFSDPCPGSYEISAATIGKPSDGLAALLNAGSTEQVLRGRSRILMSDGQNLSKIASLPDEGFEFRYGGGAGEEAIDHNDPVVIEMNDGMSEASLKHCESFGIMP